MTFELTANRSFSFIASLFGVVAQSLRAAATRRAQRLALAELLRMDPIRLDDLGLNQQDIFEAMAASAPVKPSLEERRTTRATHGLSHAAA